MVGRILHQLKERGIPRKPVPDPVSATKQPRARQIEEASAELLE